MRNASLTKLLVIAMATIALAGCVDDGTNDESNANAMGQPVIVNLDDAMSMETQFVEMTFEESVVDAGADRTGDLYEPTIEVCDDGSIYITGHTIAVDTTGAPVFGSHDDGATWEQLPWFQEQTLNGRMVQGSTPPVSDEIFLACGDDGMLYGSDITLASYPVNSWSNYGKEHSYWNFNAYDEAKAAEQAAECQPVPAKDRPWSAYSNGVLLLTSNPAGGPNQIGVVNVPFEGPAPVSMGAVVDGIDWNLCAGPGGSIPGIPDIREDGLFAAPQKSGNTLTVTFGNAADVMDIETKTVLNFTTIGEITSVYGHSIFDAEGNLFVGISNNTRTLEYTEGIDVQGNPTNTSRTVPHTGGFLIVTSTDGGETFQQTNFTTERPLRHFYMDANEEGPGAIVVWAVEGEEEGYDWFVGHLAVDADGAPVLERVGQAIDDGIAPSAHVTGAAVGPDGRAYLAMFTSNEGSPQQPTHPLSVFIQRDGPTLKVNADPSMES